MKPIKVGHAYQLHTHRLGKPLKSTPLKADKNLLPNSFSFHLQQTIAQSDVKFSQHAVQRMKERGIEVTQELIHRINQGMSKAQAKGAKESLFLIDDHAFVISVKNQTVITAMEREDMQEQMVTNIDSAVLL